MLHAFIVLKAQLLQRKRVELTNHFQWNDTKTAIMPFTVIQVSPISVTRLPISE